MRRGVGGVVKASATSNCCAAFSSATYVPGRAWVCVGRGGGHQSELLRATYFVRLLEEVI